MRHKFATDLLEKGANIRTVQHLLDHENLATTQVYLSITEKNIREAINLVDTDKNIVDLSYDQDKIIDHENGNRPLIYIRPVDKPNEYDQSEVMSDGYYSHFEIWNEG